MSQLHNIITTLTNRIMKISGCPVNRLQFIILRELYSKDDLNQTALARLIGMDRNNLSRVCAELEKSGLIFRKPRENDKRHNTIALTDFGKAVYLRGNQAMENYRTLTHAKYSHEEWSHFKEMLQDFFSTLVNIMELPDEALVPENHLRSPLEVTPQSLSAEQDLTNPAAIKATEGVPHD